jgi:hypothetical protein
MEMAGKHSDHYLYLIFIYFWGGKNEKTQHLQQNISAHVNGGPSGGSSVHTPGSEDPHRFERKFFLLSFSPNGCFRAHISKQKYWNYTKNIFAPPDMLSRMENIEWHIIASSARNLQPTFGQSEQYNTSENIPHNCLHCRPQFYDATVKRSTHTLLGPINYYMYSCNLISSPDSSSYGPSGFPLTSMIYKILISWLQYEKFQKILSHKQIKQVPLLDLVFLLR